MCFVLCFEYMWYVYVVCVCVLYVCFECVCMWTVCVCCASVDKARYQQISWDLSHPEKGPYTDMW